MASRREPKANKGKVDRPVIKGRSFDGNEDSTNAAYRLHSGERGGSCTSSSSSVGGVGGGPEAAPRDLPVTDVSVRSRTESRRSTAGARWRQSSRR